MITPSDLDIILAMAGQDFGNQPPQDFVAEYETRLRMLASVGVTGGLGPVAVMQLLRDFKITKQSHQQASPIVADWSQVKPDSRIHYQGRDGVFSRVEGQGTILIKLDGYRALHEVPSSEVTLKDPLVEGVADEVFRRDPAESNFPDKSQQGEGDNGPSEAFLKWQGIEAGTEVTFKDEDGKEQTGQFLDIEDNDQVTMFVGDDEVRVDASQVELPEPVS